MAYFVEVKWSGRDEARINRDVRYIAHREEGLAGGRTRTLYGLGERYRSLAGDERAIREQIFHDGDGLRDPRYHRGKLTVDDDAARRFARLSPEIQERVLRDAAERTFRGTQRRAQGVFVVHMHGGRRRPAGHPHVHFRLSPLLSDGRRTTFTPRLLAAFKERWTQEVDRGLDRALVRQDRKPEPERSQGKSWERPEREQSTRPTRTKDERERTPRRPRSAAVARAASLFGTSLGRGSLRVYAPGVAETLRARDAATAAVRSPGQALARAAFNAVTRALPAPLRTGVALVRGLGRLRQND
jgi:hypothetical protein